MVTSPMQGTFQRHSTTMYTINLKKQKYKYRNDTIYPPGHLFTFGRPRESAYWRGALIRDGALILFSSLKHTNNEQ